MKERVPVVWMKRLRHAWRAESCPLPYSPSQARSPMLTSHTARPVASVPAAPVPLPGELLQLVQGEMRQKGHGQLTVLVLGAAKNRPLGKGEKVAGLREGQGQRHGGTCDSPHLPYRVCGPVSPFFPSPAASGGGAGQYFTRFSSPLLPFLAACQSLSYGKQDKGSDFMSSWTRSSNS